MNVRVHKEKHVNRYLYTHSHTPVTVKYVHTHALRMDNIWTKGMMRTACLCIAKLVEVPASPHARIVLHVQYDQYMLSLSICYHYYYY